MIQDAGRSRRLIPTAITLALLFLADVGVTGQGFFSLAVALLGILLLIVGAAWAALRGEPEIARIRAVKSAFYLALGLLTVGVIRVHQFTAVTRAERLIEACRAYQTKHGSLPVTLQQLVPEFLPAIPRAKYTLMYGEFTYWVTSDGGVHHLMYVVVPPYGRRNYNFERNTWGIVD